MLQGITVPTVSHQKHKLLWRKKKYPTFALGHFRGETDILGGGGKEGKRKESNPPTQTPTPDSTQTPVEHEDAY